MPYDLIIIGGGCAGLAASVYAKRFNLNVLLITESLGGTITSTHLVENYPGFPSISGQELANKFIEHAKVNAVPMKIGMRITKIWKDSPENGDLFHITAGADANAESFDSKTVLLATGTKYRKLGIPGEAEFASRGVSYCATCDGRFFKGKNVIIVGGGDSAVKESLILAEHAAHVTLIYRGEKLAKAEPINLKRMEATANISTKLKTNLTEIFGDTLVRGVKLDDGTEMPINGVFVEVGRIPETGFLDELKVEKNDKGEVIINGMSETNVEGFYAAGDTTNTEWKQAVVSATEGCKAAFKAFEFVSGRKK